METWSKDNMAAKPVRPMDRSVMGNDAMVQRMLCQTTNMAIKAELEKGLPPGAKIVMGEGAEAPASPDTMLAEAHAKLDALAARKAKKAAEVAAEMSAAVDPLTAAGGEIEQTAPVLASPAAPVPHLLFTGRSRAGKTFLAEQMGATVLSVQSFVADIARVLFPKSLEARHPDGFRFFCARIREYGCGRISTKYPLDVVRLLVCSRLCEQWPDFGTPECWVKNSLELMKTEASTRYALEGIETLEEYKACEAAGLKPYHVMASNLTISNRGGAIEATGLTQALDNDVIKQMSQRKDGPKLNCVWCDQNYPPPSKLMLSTEEFLAKQL